MLEHLSSKIFLVVLTILLSTITIYLYSSHGSKTTETFFKYSDSMYISGWANLSPNLRKYVLLIIQNGQIQHEYSGYGLIQLNLESFANVCNNRLKKRELLINIIISGDAEGRQHLFDFRYIFLEIWNARNCLCLVSLHGSAENVIFENKRHIV